MVVDSPRDNIFGGMVAAPAFEKIGAWYARRFGIPPDKPGPEVGPFS